MRNRSNFLKFRLVMGKNLLLLSRNKRATLLTFLIPILFVGIMIFLRYATLSSYIKREALIYAPLGLHHRPDSHDFPIRRLAYYPKNYTKEMDAIKERLSLKEAPIGFDSIDELNVYLKNSSNALAIKLQRDETHNVLRVTLKAHWMTTEENLKEVLPLIIVPDLASGGRLYYRQGFTYMQQMIFEVFFGKANNVSVMLERYPVQPFVDDLFLLLARSLGTMLLAFAFYNVYLYNVKHIVQEKESQLKEMMLIMGLPNWVDWLAWFTKIMLENIPISILIVVLLKIPITEMACIPLVNSVILWLVIMIFIVTLSTFSMMVSTFFSNSRQANLFGGILYMASMIPILSASGTPSMAMTILGLVLTPSAFGFAFRWLILFEEYNVGMQWKYLFTSIPGDVTFPMFYYLTAMVLMNGVHILIMLYVEAVNPGEFGSPKPWYFPIQGLFSKRSEYIELGHSSNHPDVKCEHPAADAVPGIVISQLTKQYNEFVAVNHLSLTINENEIMVLLGENGAGKSTTLSMLTGVIPPSQGTAIIYGKDIRSEMTEIRNQIGLCPQKNVHFNEMTVIEHLLFFSQLKGLTYDEAMAEGTGFMTRLGLADKKDELVTTLSGGMKRKLNLAIALAGRTKAVFLDEPTSGVDPASRRDIWKILQEEKQHRMILLSTHFMDEADVLGDRVAILQHGELKCCGSAFFLKTSYHSNYKLTCAVHDKNRIDEIVKLIKRFIPDVSLRDNYGDEYHFDLNPVYLPRFGDLFKEFELRHSSIGLESYGIELPSLEDVFLKVQRGTDQLDAIQYRRLDIASDSLYEPLSGSALHWNWLKATAKKKHYYNLQNVFGFLVQIFLPTVWLGFTLLGGASPTAPTEQVELTLDSYGRNLITLLEAAEGSNPGLIEAYKSIVEPYGTVTTVSTADNINDYVLGLDLVSYEPFKQRAVVGARFTNNNSVLAMFNNQAGNAIPITLTTIYNAIIKSSKTDYPQFMFIYEPYKSTREGEIVIDTSSQANMVFSMILAMALIIETALMGAYYVADRHSGSLNIQFISGMSPLLYWIFTLLMDLIPFNVSIFSVTILYVVADVGDKDTLPLIYLIMLCFGVSVLPFVYLHARRYKTAASIFATLVTQGIIALVVYVVVFLMKMSHDLDEIAELLDSVFLIHPSYNLMSSVLTYVRNRTTEEESTMGLWKNYLYFVASGAVFLITLIVHDLQLMNWLYTWTEKPVSQHLGNLEEDVLAEMVKVDAMTPAVIKSKLLVAKHLKKSYGKKAAVRDVSFAMNGGECLGLLGQNGAGKTTTFKMLTGEETIRYGDAWLKGISIKSDLLKAYSHFGYCPQVDSVLEDLTGLQSMEVIALVRGVPAAMIEDISKTLAHELGFDKHMKKTAAQMSGGNKRKLCTALALIGSPSMVYMDEPSTGMDPVAKRHVWDVVGKFRHGGHAIILTTHSMEECEALCTRLAILKNGKMEAIASSYNLKQKYAKRGHLVIQLERSRRTDETSANDLKRFLPGQLNDLVLKGEYQGKLEFEFDASVNLSKVFNLMESIKKKYSIESYAVSNQNNLDNVFLEFVADNHDQD